MIVDFCWGEKKYLIIVLLTEKHFDMAYIVYAEHLEKRSIREIAVIALQSMLIMTLK